MRKLVPAALAAVVALAASSALARKVQVPIEGRGRVLVVEATINQRFTGRFLLDTGATYCVISKEAAGDAALAGRRDGEKVRLFTAGGIMLEATVGEARRIDLGDAVARDVEVAVVEQDPAPGLQGVIGLSFLRHFKYSVDSEHGLLLLEN